MRSALTRRLFFAAVIIAVFLTTEFGVVLWSYAALNHATKTEERAEQSVATATALDTSVLQLQAGSRGYIITHEERFLGPWKQALAHLPAQTAALQRLDRTSQTSRLAAAARHYVDAWALPIVSLARANPAAARTRVAMGEGDRLETAFQRDVNAYVSTERALAQRERNRVRSDQRFTLVTGAVGGVARLVAIAVIFLYFLLLVVRPVIRIARATELVAEGDLDVLVPETGAGEVGDLARAFNAMSRSLARQQRSLEGQNLDLERLANVLRAVLDSTVDGILLSDAEGNVQLANRPIVQLTQALGMTFEGTVIDRLLSVADRMKDPDGYRGVMERLRITPEDSTFNEFEDVLTGHVYQGWTAAVRDDAGSFLGRIWTMRDVTDQRELDRLKDEFVATVSHELRTPLTSMMGFLQMIREGEAGELSAEQERFLAIVYRSSERLQRLVGDLLFVARLDASGLQLQFGEVRVDAVVQEAIETVTALARSRELTLVTELEELAPIEGDRERLLQLFGNLLSNALKFTPAGGTVTTRMFAGVESVVVEIQDTGVGIPPSEQERVFTRFFRSSTATAQAIPGTGLGLVISKAIAEAHGGTIGVRSQPGEGTCFRVELPLERPAEDEG